MTEIPEFPSDHAVEKKERRLANRDVARLGGLFALGALVAVFVIQNSQDVVVRFWFFSRHPPLIFIVIGCLAVGGLGGYVAGRRKGPGRRRRKQLEKANPGL
jgi:uncharacterized integral membrane protein